MQNEIWPLIEDLTSSQISVDAASADTEVSLFLIEAVCSTVCIIYLFFSKHHSIYDTFTTYIRSILSMN